MDSIKEFNFKVNGFDIKASYFQKTIEKPSFSRVINKTNNRNFVCKK